VTFPSDDDGANLFIWRKHGEAWGSEMLSGVYEPETVRALSEALRAGMEQIERTATNALLLSGRPELSKALVRSLLAAANSGETDPERFRAIALNWARAHFPDEGIDLDLRVLDHWRRNVARRLSSRAPSVVRAAPRR
jgi:hypothetical protein